MIATRKPIGPRLTRLEVLAREALRTDAQALERLRLDPTGVMTASGQGPDPWQERVLRTDADRVLLLCSRQAGKSSVSAALALATALRTPRAPVLLLSPSDRQSGELFRKVVDLYDARWGACSRPSPARPGAWSLPTGHASCRCRVRRRRCAGSAGLRCW